jgi:hypothetical protein
MRQLLLLFAIHIMIFYQQKKDKQERFLITLEKKTAVHVNPPLQPDWSFLLVTPTSGPDSLYTSHKPLQIAYNFKDYSYLKSK